MLKLSELQKFYQYTDTLISVSQTLGVKWFSDDSIRFSLTSENDLCEFKQNGIAVNDFPDMDPEFDEDAEGRGYPAIEYRVVDGGKLSAIRIEMLEKSMAQIKYSYSKYRDECDPEAEAVMGVIEQAADL